ncbi:signal transduction histidine kinase [Micromonospora luteifusca]|uniref:histidine kinase n=1 Tax=Micromonospora luteifusca TaxID=709860 RepID=A0ABS2LTI5_9ACTN|nr:histidine kinase [Micromonospora luteifusca]MBM7491490.1 signal transduction histidine kinase [Micromonospora luteifusca]
MTDAALTTAVLLAQLAPFVSNDPPPGHAGWEPLVFLPMLVTVVPLLWRRRAPFVVLIVIELGAGAYALLPEGAPQPVWYGALVAMFTLAAQAPRWQRVSALVFIGWGALLVTGSLDTAARGVLLWLAAYMLGRAWAARGTQTAALQERTRHLERARELEAAHERARIAREMHDILGHGMSVMIAQAEAGPVFVGRDDARTTASFEVIASTGREAMAQLRRILGVLGQGPDDLAPAPTLSGLPDLVARVGRSGVDVQLIRSGEPGMLGPDGEAAAYRIVQEGLTNVLKHARREGGAVRADVTLDWHDDGLRLRVVDNGDGGPPDAEGRGLVGIAERAAACGGTATWGPRQENTGFELSVHLSYVAVPGATR